MTWPSTREFLRIPHSLTGRNVGIAVIDGGFPNHPDIASNERRSTFIVKTSEDSPRPVPMEPDDGPWFRGLHGLQAAAAAAGSGKLSDGRYAGAAPDADLYLLETGRSDDSPAIERKFADALGWLSRSWRHYNIRGVVLTVIATRDTGLLPWQADPIRVLCERLAEDGMLVVVASGNTKELICNGPGTSPSVLSVGGVIMPENGDMRQAMPYHGCRGVTFEGKHIPEIVAPAENVVLPTPFRSPEERLRHFTASTDDLPEGYARTEGTSFAGPIALGCAACIWQAHPDWSANQVKSAILESSNISGPWHRELSAGLIDVGAAVNSSVSLQNGRDTPLLSGQNQKDGLQRLGAINARIEEADLPALLSCIGTPCADEKVGQLKKLSLHRSDSIRAAAITALAFRPDTLGTADLRRWLRDGSRYARMAALFALERYPGDRREFSGEVSALFGDPDLNLRFWAFKLAASLQDPTLVAPLLSGLYDDAAASRVSPFAARVSALEAITGVSFDPVPEWRDGQCFYSERTTESRLHIARKWAEWRGEA